MTNKEFCKIDTAFYGEEVDNIKQIRLRSFTGEELKQYLEAAITVAPCCIRLKVSKEEKTLELENELKELTEDLEFEMDIPKVHKIGMIILKEKIKLLKSL